ncbi:anthranilate phosphoribosyltransferase [Litorivicinus lipolyticus]|uniref:Anthranilate phosphoribosyltransferase n=1 Tax=Litorivicinus lipolyticus TaxID=418701 RepID=A0A5Q2Q8P7_9GAMM|nr:anthranilate phosphoribosyltransferase [Litorivicinus lipolyticus]QGG81099.1 anthranilate phosphoribosyltransferase [Litorivicinus lipolyticus]
MIQSVLKQLMAGNDLSVDSMRAVMREIMTGQCTDAQIGGFLVALALKGESVDEITAAAEVMRELSSKVSIDGEHLVDTCGTGGDGSSIFNVSTASAFVAAAAGAQVAKHGNRSVSSTTGSADLLEHVGVRLDLNAEQVKACVDRLGVGFMFAPSHHSAMKHAIGPRKEMAVRTVFNLLGPLTNPAGAPNQVLGVFSADWVEPMAHVLKALGSNHVMVVHSDDGLDEISIATPTLVAELKDGEVTTWRLDPADYDAAGSLENLAVRDVAESHRLVMNALNGVPGPESNIVALNAGAAIYVSGLAPSMAAGVTTARAVMASSEAAQRLSSLAAMTQEF